MTRRLFANLAPEHPEPDKWDKDRYCTPPEALELVYEMFEARGGIGLDPCSDPDSIVEAFTRIDVRDGGDGLTDGWWESLRTQVSGALAHPPTVFYNCPYSAIGPWTGVASVETADHGLETVGLFPPHMDTIWWDDTVWKTAASVCFVRGRYAFLRNGVVEAHPRYASAWVLHAGDSCRSWAMERFEDTYAKSGQVIHSVDGKWGTSLSKRKGFHV